MMSGSRLDSGKLAACLRLRTAAILTAAAMLVAAWGCSGGVPDVSSSTAEATVKGTVKVRGKVATKGKVIFDPANMKRPDTAAREAPINQDGTYEIKAIVGGNSVRLSGPLLAKEPSLEYQSLPAEIQSGENKIDLEFLP
ncbi:hypothetical protein V5E97_04300 [Singulisphaera sp. Ch08]|uniref:Carboxypeptidase regulatory-like domain-containing protein n=1 Tax=Singulisphaera sp. Ch08 TaxID=3120278 RepID=A0AAU7CJR5_9BACT